MWETIQATTDPLAWIAISAFFFAMVADVSGNRRWAVLIGAVAWVLFAGFWAAMFPYFYFEFRSPLNSILSLAAVPLCLLAGYYLATGRESMLVLSRAVGIMGLLYLPAMLYEPLTRGLIEIVTIQTHMGMELIGYSPGIEEGPNGYQSRFAFEGYSTYIVLACTGIGSIAIFGGIIGASSASLGRKLLAISLAAGIIWVLNIVRNVFVGLAAPLGWFDYPALESLTMVLAGEGMRTSFFVSHHLLAQSGAVIALIGIALLVIKITPEVLVIIDEALYVVTGSEWNLDQQIDRSRVRADGGKHEERNV